MGVTASAPGKLMLLGEHAVVYGHPCLVTAVGLRFHVRADLTDSSVLEIATPRLQGRSNTVPISSLGERVYTLETAFVEAAVAAFFARFGRAQGLRIVTNGPGLSYGLGSSSAITVATVAALSALFNETLSPRDMFDLSYQAVLGVQGVASGFDVASATYGGTLYYAEGGKIIEPLPIRSDLPLLVAYSGSKEGTVDIVKAVADLRARRPAVIHPLFSVIHALVEDGKRHILAEQWPDFGEDVRMNQGLLAALGVSSPRLDALIGAANAAGALGAKLSGAGKGDCLFAVVQPDMRTQVAAALQAGGGQIIEFPLHAPGVTVTAIN